eukprot:6206167-Pleurochrysis_carterae.AAC.5
MLTNARGRSPSVCARSVSTQARKIWPRWPSAYRTSLTTLREDGTFAWGPGGGGRIVGERAQNYSGGGAEL